MAFNYYQRLTHKWTIASFVAGILLSVFITFETKKSNAEQLESATTAFTEQITQQILRRIELYQYGLRGARGAILTAGAEYITRKDFEKYSATRDVDVEFPGAAGFGYIRRVKPVDEAAFIAAARVDGWPSFTIKELAANSDER